MKSARKTKMSTAKGGKAEKEEKEKKKREEIEAKNQEKEMQFNKLEEYVNESGLSLAFNIIFAELISKQIMPENFFTYTSMRLKQIGKEIEGLKTKEEINVENNGEEDKKEVNNEQPNENDNKLFQANKNDDDNVLLTVQDRKAHV